MGFKKILAISPHTDDIELSCGGSVAKFIAQQSEVHYVALSDCNDTLVGTPFKDGELGRECKRALRVLGVMTKNIHIFHQTNKHYYRETREIFDILEELKNKIRPDVILIPDPRQTHQDHSTVAKQAISVFRRDTSIICYEQPWNDLNFIPNFFVRLTDKELTLKIKAISKYKTQFIFKRTYLSEEFIRGLAATRGSQINTQYAEGFKVLKLIS